MMCVCSNSSAAHGVIPLFPEPSQIMHWLRDHPGLAAWVPLFAYFDYHESRVCRVEKQSIFRSFSERICSVYFDVMSGPDLTTPPKQNQAGSQPENGEFRRIRLIHGAHSKSQADIWLVEWQCKECVLRDYSGPRRFYWRCLCRWAVKREIKVHQLLDGIDGIPRLLKVIDKDRYLIEFIQGCPLHSRKHCPTTEFFEKLGAIVDQMHSHHVAHGDFRNKNIMVGPNESPYIIDFSTAWWGTAWWRKPLFRFYCRLDDRRLALSRAHFHSDLSSQEEYDRLKAGPFYIQIGRFYRKTIYPLLAPNRSKKARKRTRPRK